MICKPATVQCTHEEHPGPQGDKKRLSQNPWVTGISQVVLQLKNPRANAGDIRDTGSIPGSGRTPGEGQSNAL